MAGTNVLTYSGNRITASFDGKTIGLIQSIRASDNYGLEDASGIGQIHVAEHVPSKAVHTISVTNMVLFTGNMRTADLGSENGADALRGLVFDIIIYGDPTKGTPQAGNAAVNGDNQALALQSGTAATVLRTYRACSFDSGDIDVTAHRITVQTGQFKALDVVSGTLA